MPGLDARVPYQRTQDRNQLLGVGARFCIQRRQDMGDKYPVSFDELDKASLIADEVRACLIEARQKLLAAHRLRCPRGAVSLRGWRWSVGLRGQSLQGLVQSMRDPIGDIRRYQRVFVLDRAQPSLADTNFMREFLLRGGAVATVAQFLDLLSIKPNFAHGVLFR